MVRSGARAFSTFTRAWSRVRGRRSREVNPGAPTKTVITSHNKTPFRVGLLSNGKCSSLGSTLNRNVASQFRTSSSLSSACGGTGNGCSLYSNTTGNAPASAAVRAAASAISLVLFVCDKSPGFRTGVLILVVTCLTKSRPTCVFTARPPVICCPTDLENEKLKSVSVPVKESPLCAAVAGDFDFSFSRLNAFLATAPPNPPSNDKPTLRRRPPSFGEM
mmetsp:Transcript_9890/g.32672  ORF Transcript_9890/g.32672 Transcript_9890/m.32672 type:complete len:219 (+) Transcript_9890:2478-3134(+)